MQTTQDTPRKDALTSGRHTASSHAHAKREDQRIDRRARRTRTALVRALMQLLREKPLQSITITELTSIADVNRATFYLHYHDVFDMYETVKQDMCTGCRALVDAHLEELEREDFNGFLTDVLTLAKENQDTFAVVLGNNADGSLFHDISAVMRDSLLTAAKSLSSVNSAKCREDEETGDDETQMSMAIEYQFEYMASGATAVLKLWLKNGCKEDVSFVTALCESLIQRTAYDTLFENLELAKRAQTTHLAAK